MQYSSPIIDKARQIVIQHVPLSTQLTHYGYNTQFNPVRCPFHDESTASFFWDDDKQVYHCFGCHAKGTVVELTRHMESEQGNPMSVVQTLEYLAEQYKVAIPDMNDSSISKGKAKVVAAAKVHTDILQKKKIERLAHRIPALTVEQQVVGWYIYDRYMWGLAESGETQTLLEDLIQQAGTNSEK